MAELMGISTEELREIDDEYHGFHEVDRLNAIALAAQKALIRKVWSSRFLGQPWESSIEEMMRQLGEMPYHFPKGTLGCTPEEKTNEEE